ncbi:T1SS-143 repeat domain-containing protein [Pseudomonas fragi]|uniref:T1SS-143 repeat domain-containing protein n=3 Tax=Pseudomonas fragi TaxID=296 RepID=UPI0038113C55
MAIILNSSITVDETSGLQNAATSTDIEDINDNDITVAAINATDDTGDLPFPFESRLFALLGATPVKNAALSGYTGAAGNTGADLITITGTYVDLAFTDAQGKALGDPGNANGGSDWSGLYTLDGTKIFLYSDTNNNIVLGRAGSEGATPAPDDDLANPNGTIIFAAYLEQTATGAKVWMVQQEQLMHPDTANPDDVVDMTNHLWVTASQDLAFDFAGLPSGQNGFLMFKAGGSTTGLIVTGMDPDQVPANQADTVNTSQGAGPTTIGTNSQGIKAGEGMIFSFITNPDARYTVPDLTHGEATNESNILFGGLFAASGATIIIAQATPPKTCAATISAFTTGLEVGSAYYDGLLDGNGHAVNGADNLGYIASVTVIGANGVAIAGLTGVTTNTTLGSISVTFTTSNAGLDRTATIVGFEANFSLQYTVDGTHNRVVIENSGTGNSTFDIGGFHLPNVVAVPQEVGSQLNFEDDGPAAAGLPVTALVDEDSLAGGIDGGVGDAGLLVPASASGTVATVFTSGTDAPASYSLSNDTSGVQVFDSAATAVALASKGETVKYDVIGNTLWGYVGAAAEYVAATDRAVFKLELTNTSDGSYTFTLLDQLDHPDTVGGDNSENELLLQLGSVLKVTDKDGDSVTATAQKLVITVDDDTPIATLNQLTGTVDEDGVLEGAANAGPGDGIAGGTGDVAGEIVLASGNISTLFQSGADEALSYSLTTNGLAALGLKSAGVTVTYAVAFDAVSSTWLLTASAGAGNTAFTFSLHATTGAYAFTLVDQLDHASGLNENDLSIALGTAINATDFDGDTVTAAANGLVITVNDDTPIATINQLTGTVDEDGVVEGAANAGPGDGIAGGTGDVAGEIVLASGNVSTLFQSGADEALNYSLTTNGLAALGLKSAGVTVTYAVAFDAVSSTWLLTASAGAGNTAFTFSLHATTGAYAFTLVDQLDHASGLNENNLTIALGTAINATDFDGDTVTAAANGLVITVNDDTPIATINQLTGTVDEDGVVEGAANAGPGDGIAGGTGDVAGEIVLASGNVSTLFQSGADEALNYSLTTNGLAALGLKSAGVTVTYAVAFDAVSSTWLLTASAGAGNTAFTFSLHATTGAYAFTLVDQLDHASGLNENDLSIALGTAINATDFDGDSVTAAANGLVITVNDDTPIATVNQLTGTVDEDGVVEGAANAGPGDGIAGGTGDVAGEIVLASGNISTLFQSGADEALNYSLTTNGLAALGLKSAGVTVTYAVAFDAVSSTWLLTASAGAGNTAFTFSLHANTGAYAFTLVDQLDHAPGLNENDLTIALGTAINATDFDGDTVTAAANGLVITVNDDTPIATVNQLTGTVDEDGVVEGAANAGPGDGIAGGTGDVAGEIVLASGNVSTLFQSGADEALSYSLTTNGLAALGLKSAGVTVTYAVAFDAVSSTWLLTASAGAGNTAFTFSLHATTGAYAFTLVDQLDHASGLNENDLSIALGTAINATDFDGDTVTAAANGLVITVNDDTPIATINQLTGTVDEDGVVEGTANAGPGDGIAGGTGDVAGEIVLASGNISTLFQSGADEALNYSLTTNGLAALGLKSAGVTVTYAVAFDAVSSTWLLTASAGAGNTAFTFSLHATTGAYAFTLVDQLDHASGLNENDLSIALGTAINATDFDGDTVTAAANGLVITVNDDTPIATINQLTGTVDEDGVVEGAANAGPGDGIAGGTGDVAGEIVLASGNVSTLFQSGADEALNYSLTTNGLAALGLTSGGVAVTYAVGFDAGSSTWLLTASAGAGNTVFTFSLHAATGAYAFTLVDQLDHAAGQNENDLTIALGTTINATDFDGDSVTAAANGLVITVDDDTPIASINLLTGTVDEDGVHEGAADSGPGDGIPGGTGDVAGEIVLASGNVSALFQSGADEPLSYSLTTNGLTALGLKSGGVTVTYATTYDAGSNTWLLTASAGAGNSVFTFSVQAATGAYAFMLLDQLDHAAGLNENDLNIALGTAINATDYDGDSVTAAANGLLITVDDDSPVVTAKSNVVYANSSNPTPGGTGVFAYDIGADDRLGTVYSSANSDLSVSMGDSTVGTTAITNKVVTWASESDTSAVFNLSFTYVSNNPTLGALTNATGTMTFDKVADTYTLSLADDIDSFSILKTSAAQGFTGYNIGGTTPINQQPPVSVAKLADDFFVQFSGFAEQGSGTGANNIMAGGNNAFVPGELFSAATSWVSVSGTAAGVAGDTIQQGEVMDLDFFTASPFGDTTAAPTATSKGIYVKFDGIGSEDLILVLKLIDPDDNSLITRAIIVDSEDIIIKNASTSPNNFHPIANPAAYGITLDQNDGAVIVESNDYNFGNENYLIQGLQVLVSTEGVTGSGYNLNGNVGVSGASTGNTLTFSNESGEGSKSNPVEAGEAGTWDGDVVKITDLGFVTSSTPDAHLTFNVVVTDADADATPAQTLDVTIEGDKTFTGGVGADTFNFSGLDTDGSLTAATAVISAGFTSGVDTLNFPTAGTGANYTEVAAPAANVAAFITAADTALNGTTNYYFGVVGGDGYLAYDGDGTGITSIIKLVGVTDIAPTDIV